MNRQQLFIRKPIPWPAFLLYAALLLLVTGATAPGFGRPTPAPAPSGTLPAWGTVPSPNGGNAPTRLHAVAVLSATDAWAAGRSGSLTYPNPVVEHWNGAAWQLVDVPASVGSAELNAVAAVAPGDVWFAGGHSGNGQALILHWDGNALQVASHPNPGLFNRLYGIAAVAPDDIWAVGEYANGGASQALTLHWDGANWSHVPNPGQPGSATSLQAVTATASNDVWAVGSAGNSTFTLHWDGAAWTAFPAPSAGSGSSLKGVAALSPGEVWAVGDGAGGLVTARWDGQVWQPMPAPETKNTTTDRNAVVALPGGEVWASGYYTSDGIRKSLLARWTDAGWVTPPGPDPDLSLNVLLGIHGSAGAGPWAVGFAGAAATGQTALIQRWDGQTWQLVAGANPGAGDNILTDISAVAPDDIWSVGNVDGDPLTLHWNGSVWSQVPAPSPPDGVELEGVVGLATDDVWAVGSTGSPASLDSSTITMRWDGSAWTIIPSPNPGGASVDRLYAVDAAAPNDIWAVGEHWIGSQQLATILRWDGNSWSIVPNNCGTPMRGLAVVAADDVWAVGDQTTCHFDGSTWTVVPSPQPNPAFLEIALPLEGLAANGPDDIWAVGASIRDYGQYLSWLGMAEHWNGSSWTRIDLPAAQVLYGVEALAANDVWAVGTTGSVPAVLHFDGGSWSQVPVPHAVGGQLDAVTSDGQGKLWAAGSFYAGSEQRTLMLEAPSSTQGTVTGDTDVATAVVSWFGPTSGSVQTNVFGDYAVAGLPAGDYHFIATFGGCTPASANVTVTAGAATVQDLPINCTRERSR